jgi:tetratricopeptide (TPR) repeat protein
MSIRLAFLLLCVSGCANEPPRRSDLAADQSAAPKTEGAGLLVPADAAQPSAPPSGLVIEAKSPPEQTARLNAKEAIDAGDYDLARTILTGLLVDAKLARAGESIEQGLSAEALVYLEEALALDPERQDALLMHGETNLVVGAELKDPLFFEDAFRSFQKAGNSPRALFGASRAAYLGFKTEDALKYARAGMRAIEGGASAEGVHPLPERTLAEACFASYIQAAQTDLAGPETRVLFEQTESALSALLARDDGDPWVWQQLSNLYSWEQRSFDAQKALERGLDRFPGDAAMLSRLYELTSTPAADAASAGGSGTGVAASITAFDRILEDHQDTALVWWYSGKVRFDDAVAHLKEDRREQLVLAEKQFRRCRVIEPTFEADCLGYEAMCRNALGWMNYHLGNLPAATQFFRSMEDVLEGGMDYRIEGSLPSGVEGLRFVADAYNQKQDWVNAAGIYDILHAYKPDDADLANNAGFFNRDGATELETTAESLRLASRGEIQNEERLNELRKIADVDRSLRGSEREREMFGEEAKKLERRAREMFERSYAAYSVAARLTPEDVRVVNDTALIQVYHLRNDIARAEELLLSCVRMGAQQLENPDLDEEARFELENAWGDAHENLGVLELEVKNNPREAIRWFEKAVEIGPAPRPKVVSQLIPRCRELLQQAPGD